MFDLGENISRFRRSRNLSRVAFADALGVKTDKIKHVETGNQRADHELLYLIGEKFDVSVDWLLGLSGNHRQHLDQANNSRPASRFVPVPRYAVEASAGGGSTATNVGDPAFFSVDRSWLSKRGLSAAGLSVIAVRGDSMEPVLEEGELIMIDTSQTVPRDSGVYVVRFSDELFVKRVQQLPGNRVQLLSDNRAYPPIVADPADAAEISIIGRVVASMRTW